MLRYRRRIVVVLLTSADLMEAAAGVVASRGGSLPMSSSRKEWRAVSDHHSVGTAGDEVVIYLFCFVMLCVWVGSIPEKNVGSCRGTECLLARGFIII